MRTMNKDVVFPAIVGYLLLWGAALAILLVLSGCAAPPANRQAIIYAPAGAIIAAQPDGRLMVKVPGRKLFAARLLHFSVPTKITVEAADPNNPPRE